MGSLLDRNVPLQGRMSVVGRRCWGTAEDMWQVSVLPIQFFCEPITALVNKSTKKKQKAKKKKKSIQPEDIESIYFSVKETWVTRLTLLHFYFLGDMVKYPL